MKQDNTDGYDYGTDASGAKTDTASLAKLSELARAQLRAEQVVQEAEDRLAEAKSQLAAIAEVQVPDIMESLGMREFRTNEGLTIQLKDIIRASIPKERAPQACAWLVANGHEALIKRSISVAFGRGENERAEQLAKELHDRGLEAEDRSTVNPSTLSAFVREKLEGGADLPMELLGVYRSRESKVALPKTR